MNDPGPDDEATNSDVQAFARRVMVFQINSMESATDDEVTAETPHLPDRLLDELREAAASDPDYNVLMTAVATSFSAPRHQTAQYIRQYWSIREESAVDDGLVLFGLRIVIPGSARKDVLHKLHAAHQGIVRMKRRARQTLS